MTEAEKQFADEVRSELFAIGEMLIQKNASYGDAALSPLRIFSRADAVEQIRVRIDDKLSRIARGDERFNEDTEQDLLGYMVLLRIASKRKKRG